MPETPVIARASLHFWEEPCISGTNGSGTVFFSGCSLRCVFCQNSEISVKNKGKSTTVKQLSELFKKLEFDGAHNINLVTPTHYAKSIIEALDVYKPSIPIVYNSSGYENVKTLEMLKDYIDIYLMDFKYFDYNKSRIYSNSADYPSVCKAALLEAYNQHPKCVFDGDIMKKGLIVRHLLLPQSTNDAINIFKWVKTNTPNAYFSLMSQYIPLEKAFDMPIINRRITKREYDKVCNFILNSNFENCYFQESSSASKKYIPDFDFTGVI